MTATANQPVRTLPLSLPARLLIIAGALSLGACATAPEQLYYWGDYQPQVYGHLTGDKGPDEQIASLEAGLEKALAKGKQPPPGYFAHLGILYGEKGDGDKMLRYFDAEKQYFPESTAFIDFLMKSKNGSVN